MCWKRFLDCFILALVIRGAHTFWWARIQRGGPAADTIASADGGFTPQDWIPQNGAEKASVKGARVTVPQKPSLTVLDEHLRRGELVTVKFFLPGGIPH